MSRIAVLQAYSARVEELRARLLAEGAQPASALKMAVNACRCYWSPPFDIAQVPEDPDGELAAKLLADDPLDEEEELERCCWDLYVDSYQVPGDEGLYTGPNPGTHMEEGVALADW